MNEPINKMWINGQMDRMSAIAYKCYMYMLWLFSRVVFRVILKWLKSTYVKGTNLSNSKQLITYSTQSFS